MKRRALCLLGIVAFAPTAGAVDGGTAARSTVSVSYERGTGGHSPFNAPRVQPDARRLYEMGPIAAPLALDGEIVIAAGLDHAVKAFGPDGVRWSRRASDLVFAPPLVDRGVVFVGGDDDVVRAYRVSDGEPRGTLRCGSCRPSVGVGPTASRCDVEGMALGPDGTIYVAADGVYALGRDLITKWHYGPVAVLQSGNPQRPIHCLSAPTVGRDGTIYVGCDDDQVHALRPDGTLKWAFNAGADVGSGIVVGPDGTIFFGTDEGKVYFLAPDGPVRAVVQLKNAVRTPPAIGIDGRYIAVTLDGAVAALTPDGSVRWVFRAAARVMSAPLVDASGLILFGSHDGRVYALDSEGSLVWSVMLDGAVTGSPVLAADGTIWIGTAAGGIYAIR